MGIKVGMRSLKTGLAVFTCLMIHQYIPLSDPILAVLVAISSIQNTIDDSVTFSKNRLIGTILGTITGIVYNQVAGDSLIFVALGVIVLITLLNSLKQTKSILIAMAVFVSIITGVVKGNPVMYGLNKFLNTLVGISVGFIINYFIKPPNQIEIMKLNVIQIVDEIEYIVRELIFTQNDISLDKFKSDIEEIENNLDIYNLDKKYNVVKMDKIKYVEQSLINYRKIYSQLYLIKDKRAPLNNENIKKSQELFNKQYKKLRNLELDNDYILIYNYHINKIMKEIVKLKEDLNSVTKGKAIKQSIVRFKYKK